MFSVYCNLTIIQVPSKLFSGKQNANSSKSVTVYSNSAKFSYLLYYTITFLLCHLQTTPLTLIKTSPITKKYIYIYIYIF